MQKISSKFISIEGLYPDLYKVIPGWLKGVIHCVTAGTGVGKCMAPDTPVMMYDCSIKLLKNINVGDKLMGDDSKPRTVLNKYIGQDDLYKVIQNKGIDYIINSQHILSLTKRDVGIDKQIDIGLPDYNKLTNNVKRRWKGYKVPLEFKTQHIPLDAYLLGLWLGDGNSSGAKITTNDPEILDYLKFWAQRNHNIVVKTNDLYGYKITTPKGSKREKLATILNKNNLIGNKHIPDCYLYNSRQLRSRLLAGLIDTDGYISGGRCEIVQKSQRLADQILFLVRSLGFRASISIKIGKCSNCSDEFNNSESIYYRIQFFGDFSEIPIRISRKIQACGNPKLNRLATGIKIEPAGFGEYVGIEVDSNGRFLLEDFTVVHNTKFTKWSFVVWSYKYCKLNNLPFYCIYFAMEESVEKFWISIACDLIKEQFGLDLTYYQYKGYHPGYTDEHKQALDAVQPEIDGMKECIYVVDHIFNPTGMYKYVRDFMSKFGKKVEGIVETDDAGNKYQSFSFEYDNPDTQVLIVTDHVGCINAEKSSFGDVSTKHAAMGKWSEYCYKFIAKKFQCIVVNVHQQEMTGDSGDNIKLGRPEPTLDKLGVNKLVGQEYMVVLGLFNPARVNPPIPMYHGYQVPLFKGHFRTVHILKHRDGEEGAIKALYFHGSSNKYEELPAAQIDSGGKKINNPQLAKFYV